MNRDMDETKAVETMLQYIKIIPQYIRGCSSLSRLRSAINRERNEGPHSKHTYTLEQAITCLNELKNQHASYTSFDLWKAVGSNENHVSYETSKDYVNSTLLEREIPKAEDVRANLAQTYWLLDTPKIWNNDPPITIGGSSLLKCLVPHLSITAGDIDIGVLTPGISRDDPETQREFNKRAEKILNKVCPSYCYTKCEKSKPFQKEYVLYDMKSLESIASIDLFLIVEDMLYKHYYLFHSDAVRGFTYKEGDKWKVELFPTMVQSLLTRVNGDWRLQDGDPQTCKDKLKKRNFTYITN